jgi:Na+:H+ antiporter, NhaA family
VNRAWRYVADHYLLLPIGGAVALIWANTRPEGYFRFAESLAFVVNDVGMALVLAYLAQEVVEAAMPGGTLYPFHRLLVPIVGGIGSTIGASLTYLGTLRLGDEQILARGWSIPGPSDVVVAMAIARAIFGRSAAVTLALAIALTSDVLGLAIISPEHQVVAVHPRAAVLIGVGIGMAALLRRRQVASSWLSVAVAGSLSWFGCYWSGIQPALALLPIVPFLRHAPRDLTVAHDHRPAHRSPTHLESVIEIPVQVIGLLFGLVNLGIPLRGYGTGTWAVLVGSLVGRPIGTLAAIGAGRLSGLRWPRGIGWRELVVVALAVAPPTVFGVWFAVSVFPVGPLRAETALGAIATVIGVLPAVMAARLLHVGRFVASIQRSAPTRVELRGNA